MLLSWLAFTASVIWRPNRGQYVAWLDAGLYDVPFALAAVACWRASLQPGAERRAWRTLAVGLSFFIAGNLYGSLVVGAQEIYPSPADGMWLTFYVLLYVVIVGLVRSRMTHFHASTWLDGGIGGVGMAALVVAFALGPTLAITDGTLSVVATNVAYPAAEVVLIMILVTSASAIRARDASFWLLGVGIAVFSVADITYLFLEADGTYAEGGLLDVLWPLGAIIMGYAACSAQLTNPAPGEKSQRYFMPVAFTATSVALLVYGQRHEISIIAVVLAGASLGIAAIRVALTVREVEALAESRHEARTDELTGLANRRYLIELLADVVAPPGGTATTNQVAALLIIDLDRFKEVNDSLGHVAGDLLLHDVAQRLSAAKPANSVLARLGGDEFAIVMPDACGDAAADLGRHLLQALVGPFDVKGMQITADASIGIACSPEHGTTTEAILARADIAMYRAKRQRTGVETFNFDTDDPSPDRLELLADLRIAANSDQFLLHYQPQLSLRSGDVIGVEALVRWNHPVRGLVPPDQFLPMLEQANQMTALTTFVLGQALGDCARLSRMGISVRMSVNISASDLVDQRLVDTIATLLDENRLGPQKLVIEITEDTVMADRARSLRTLHRIRAMGVHVSVDDYGTGQASLSYIRDLPVTELKLDRSFLEGVPADTHNAAIIRSTIELAHSLGLPLVAEGVEDRMALDWLRQLGCDIGQGYHISRPMAFPQLLAWLREHAVRPEPIVTRSAPVEIREPSVII